MDSFVVSPSAAMTGAVEGGRSPLADLQAFIAALRVKAQVAQVVGQSTATMSDLPMAAVFDPIIKPREGLSADRDSSKRDEKIMTMLRERGALRVVGGVASPSLAQAISQLYESHANFSAAIDYVLGEEILARQRNEALCGLRLLLHGGAGVGKTDFSLTLAKLLGVPVEVLSFSSAQAAAYLAGSEEYWSNTKPGIVWQLLIQGNHANPIFVLDEIDKTSDRWGDPLGALYPLLEHRSAAIFCDKSIPWLPIDASRCNWIATANYPEQLHPAIRSRFTEIEVTTPTEDALLNLLQKLYRSLLAEFSLADRFAEKLSTEQAGLLLGGSIRDAKRLLRSAVAQALRDGKSEVGRRQLTWPVDDNYLGRQDLNREGSEARVTVIS